MKNLPTSIAFVAVVSLATTWDISAQQLQDASLLIVEARHEEMVSGNLSRAIELYRQVAESASASRPEVSEALLALGNAYELTGSVDAASIYRRLVSEFSDQPAAFLAAQEKLNSKQDYALLLEDLPPFMPVRARHYDFSPDGKKLVVNAPASEERMAIYPNLFRELYILEVGSLVRRPAVEDPKNWEFMNTPRWSPDGRYILFSVNYRTSDGVKRAVQLLDLSTNQVTELQGDFSASQAWSWMPNSREFVSHGWERGLRIHSLDGSTVRQFDLAGGHMFGLGDVSPDGNRILYHRLLEGSEIHGEIDVWMFDFSTGESTRITDDPAYEGWPTWGEDGKSVYYAGGSGGVQNVYKQKIESGEDPIQLTSYSNAMVTYPLVVGDGKLTFTLMKDNHTVVTASTSQIDSPRPVVRGRSPMLSPDGKTVYYLDDEPGQAGIWASSTDGRTATQLVSGDVSVSYATQPFLSPAGTRLAYFLLENDSANLYVIPSQGGTANLLYSAVGHQMIVPAWSPDGTEIAFVDEKALKVVASEGGDALTLAEARGWEGWNVEWSPDGSMIAAFGYVEGEGENVIFVVDRETKELLRLTPETEDDYKEILSWHPDGDRISYMYYGTTTGDGSRTISLTGEISDLANMSEPQWDYIGIWGPDKRYYFNSTPRGFGNASGLYSLDENTRMYRTIRKDPDISIGLPTWSADGSVIAWSENEVSRQLWMISDYE